MGMISDFKEFAMGGNLIDMATGIIIGVASGKLISSLVSDVIMPPIGVALGGVDFSDLGYKLADTGGGDKGLDPIMLNWGAFVQSFIDFLIIMLVVFIIVKIASRGKEEEEEETGPSQEDLLTEIRDALQKN
ncbi:MAG TPA: large-conductance mechanosensitive channel protein MscL [Leucothrix mucor]|nr:large-conductance mechanosensitive channel protein MscL [Leucothrix mucor]